MAASYGIALDDHRPQTLTRELIHAYNLVVVMESAQVDQLRAAYPQSRGRLFLLSLFDEGATEVTRSGA